MIQGTKADIRRVDLFGHRSRLGTVHIACSDKGLLRIVLPGLPLKDVQHKLRARFGHVALRELTQANAMMRQVIAAIDATLDDTIDWQQPASPPMDLDLSDFARQVLTQIANIPRGQTRSYKDIAQALHRPQASRAVGQACARNPVPLLIPCHRVLASRGRLGGFAGGLQLKRQLLVREGALLT